MRRLFAGLLSSFVIAFGGVIFSADSSFASDSRPYFQQRVHYTLDATMRDDLEHPKLDGKGSLDYTNNSPDTLREVYFHLYWNLFKPGSYGKLNSHDDEEDADDEGAFEGITITHIAEKIASTERDATARCEVDNTILHLQLAEPILPHSSRTFTFEWKSEMPNFNERSTWGFHDYDSARSFSTAQWYPQICVYDNRGWHPDQYIGFGEFYTDYGMFDVTLHLPKSLATVVSTGWQTNPQILPASVRDHLAFARSHPDSLTNIDDRGRFSRRQASRELQTWKFHADSVRDFAWCADEAFIWDAIYSNGTMHSALYWEGSRRFWGRDAARIAAFTVQTDSKNAGQYIYPNLFMCESFEGGMEYPGIVYIGPYTEEGPTHYAQNTMMHEIGHEWYPMMMGSNETDYGYMDEGFNTYITTLVQEAWFGRYGNYIEPGYGTTNDERLQNQRESIQRQLSGFQEPAETKADLFQTYHTYSDATYPHTSSVFVMLRYTMGETAFKDFLHAYYDRWRCGHPYPNDLRDVAEEINLKEGDTSRVRARGDLRWFFDEWFDKTWKVDYGIASFKSEGNAAKVRISRLERGVMPIDLVFTMEDGSKEQRWIAVDDWLRTVSTEREYTFNFEKHPSSVEINPSGELLDVNRLNNTSGLLPKFEVSLLPKVSFDYKPLDAYAIRSAPYFGLLGTNLRGTDNGPVIGWTLLGSYMERTNRIAIGIRAEDKNDILHPILGGVAQYHTAVDMLSPWTDIDVTVYGSQHSQFTLLRAAQMFSPTESGSPSHTLDVSIGYGQMDQPGAFWPEGIRSLTVGYTFKIGSGSNYFAASFESDHGLDAEQTVHSKLAAMIDARLPIGGDWDIFLRGFGGSNQSVSSYTFPVIDHFDAGGVSPWQALRDRYGSNFGSNARALIRNPTESGPSLRGFAVDQIQGTYATTATFEFSNKSLFPLGWLKAIPYVGKALNMIGLSLFADAGVIANTIALGTLREQLVEDWGVGLRFRGDSYFLPRFYGVDLDRTEFRLDAPIYVSAPRPSDSKYAFRLLLGFRQNF